MDNINFNFGDLLFDLRRNIRKYLFGEDYILDEIATRISATFKWVIERNAATMLDKAKEIEDFVSSEKELQIRYSGMHIKDVLDDLTKRQARILWFFRGCKQNQSLDEQKDDYYNAKRYIAFLLADMLLLKCKDKKICPEMSLKPEYIEYLQGITIEEFTRYKAYLRWRDRNINNYPKDNDKYLEDYFSAINFLDKTAINCKNKQCGDTFEYWKRIIESGDYIAKLDMIKIAKINTLRRLFREDPEKMNFLDQFVTNFYENIKELVIRNKDTLETIKDIVSTIYEKSDVVNMFEFILKCFLVSKLTREEHNQIRAKYNKPSIELALK